MPEVYRQGDVIFRRTNREIDRYAMKESDQLVVTGETGKATQTTP
jgi:dihydrodipicolinate synthase/N-acetylneuraminate lyase